MVLKVASIDSSDLGGVGSMISRSPSLRIMASSPGSSNSRGILTAWFLPFLKSFTCRSGAIPTSLAYDKAYAAYACFASTSSICNSRSIKFDGWHEMIFFDRFSSSTAYSVDSLRMHERRSATNLSAFETCNTTVLVGVVAITLEWETGVLQRLSLSSTSGVEHRLLDRFRPIAYSTAPGTPLVADNKNGLSAVRKSSTTIHDTPTDILTAALVAPEDPPPSFVKHDDFSS